MYSLEEDPYNLDRSEMVSSSVPLSSDMNGNIVGVDTQVTPSGFAYKRDLAKEYLGTDDPAEVGEMIKDWDSFLEVGKQVSEKSGGKVKMMASLGDVLLCTISQNVVDYVDGTNVNITEKMTKPLEITMKLRDAGIIGDLELYSAAWYSAYASDDILFYECAAWAPSAVIKPNDQDDDGNWAIALPPEGSFNQGGTTVSIYKDSPNKEAAWAYLKYTFFSEEGAENVYNRPETTAAISRSMTVTSLRSEKRDRSILSLADRVWSIITSIRQLRMQRRWFRRSMMRL